MQESTPIFTTQESDKSFRSFIDDAFSRYSNIFILTDHNTQYVCLPWLKESFKLPGSIQEISIEPGEKSKNIQYCMGLWQDLAARGADRYSLLICLGGGVVCDMGGFLASTYQRGIDFIFVPTTLLAQVDAAIGGKTGVNLGKLKNYIGVFSQPKAIFIFTEFLRTLPFDELLSGYAEVVKHALLNSEKSFRELVAQFPDAESVRQRADWSSVVERSARIKSNVVKLDPYERGMRKVLNLGHTAGHAFESHSIGKSDKRLLHGLAVAMGLIIELKLSVQMCNFPDGLAEDIIKYILSVFPVYLFDVSDLHEITGIMGFDKKNKGGTIHMTLMRSPGDLMTDVVCSRETIEHYLLEYLDMCKAHFQNNRQL